MDFGPFGEDEDDNILARYATVQRKLREWDSTKISGITNSVTSADELHLVSDKIATVVRNQYRVIPGEEDDSMMRTDDHIHRLHCGGLPDPWRHRHLEHHVGSVAKRMHEPDF